MLSNLKQTMSSKSRDSTPTSLCHVLRPATKTLITIMTMADHALPDAPSLDTGTAPASTANNTTRQLAIPKRTRYGEFERKRDNAEN